MNALTNIQIINGVDGNPAFVVIPYADYVSAHPREQLVPNDVVGFMVREGLTAVAAWRRHLKLTQTQVAGKMGITQAAFAQQEAATRPRKATREKIAAAMGIPAELLDI